MCCDDIIVKKLKTRGGKCGHSSFKGAYIYEALLILV